MFSNLTRKHLLIMGALVVIPIAVVVIFAAMDEEESGPSKIVIAASMPLDAELGRDMLSGIELALEEAGGKAGDLDVELLVLNSSSDTSPFSNEQEALNAAEVAENDDVVAYIGAAASGQSKEAIPVLNEAGIPQVSPSSTWPGLTKLGFGAGEPGMYYPTGRRTFFRVVPSDDAQGTAGARWAADMGLSKVFLVDDTTVYGSGLAGIFEVAAQDVGLEIVGHEQFTFDGDATTVESFSDLVQTIVAADPDLVFLGGYAEEGGAELIAALFSAAPDIRFMGADGLVQNALIEKNGPELSNGVLATNTVITVAGLETELGRAFNDSYLAAHSDLTIVPPFAATGYEAMRLVLYALETADEPTREGVLDVMSDLGDYNGILGTWHFDSNGDIQPAPISAWQVQDGQWQFLQIIK